jgi:hypothetical protein
MDERHQFYLNEVPIGRGHQIYLDALGAYVRVPGAVWSDVDLSFGAETSGVISVTFPTGTRWA